MSAEEPTRRRSTPLAAALVLAALPLVLFSESLFGDAVLSQLDALLEFPPWSSVAPEGYRPENPLLLDQALLMRPWLEFATERVRAGELPLWNPYNYCGQPITAAVTGATYWPLHLVHYAFPTPEYHGWSAALRVFLAGWFTWLFLRRLGISPGAGLAGAVAFASGGFMIAWLNHPHTNAALCLPLILWSVERLAERPGGRRTAWLAISLALPLVAGHLQTAVHVLLAAGAYAVFRTRFSFERPGTAPPLGRGGLARFAVAGAIACALAAPQVLPFVEYYRASLAKDLFAEFDTTSEFPRAAALQLMVAPDSLGGPHTGDWEGPTGFNVNYNELIGGYVGRLPLALAVAGLVLARRRRTSWFFAGLALVAALVAWRVPPFYEAARAVPLLGSTKLLRFLLLLSFALAVLAAHGLDALARRLGGRRAAVVAGAAVLLTAADLVEWGRGYNPAIDPALIAPETPVTRFLGREEEPYRALGVDNRILLPNANLFHRVPLVSGYDSIEYRPMAELASRLTTDPLAGFEEILGRAEPPDTGFIKEIRWFDRLEALPLLSLLGVKYVLSPLPLPEPFEHVFGDAERGELLVHENPRVLPRVFVADGWAVVPDRDARLDRMASGAFDPRLALLERPAPPGFEAPRDVAGPAGTASILEYEPRRVVLGVRLERPGLVVLADAWDPGWSATADGRDVPVERVQHALRGLFLGPGEHRVELRYDPATTRYGLLLAGIAGVLCLGMIATGRG